MEDKEIIKLFFARSERAIEEVKSKYHAYVTGIIRGILGAGGDTEECEDDAYMRLWENIPPQRPENLSLYLGRTARNLALDRVRAQTADKRGGSELTLAIDELEEALPDGTSDPADSLALSQALNGFIRTLSPRSRRIFIRRYFYMASIADISREYKMSESAVKMSLARSRERLREHLINEGIWI